MTEQPDWPDIHESDVFLAGDALAMARYARGTYDPITDKELAAAEEMTRKAWIAWRESEGIDTPPA